MSCSGEDIWDTLFNIILRVARNESIRSSNIFHLFTTKDTTKYYGLEVISCIELVIMVSGEDRNLGQNDSAVFIHYSKESS